MALQAYFYSSAVKKGKVAPALSTWITFLVGTSLSLTTYLIASEHDFRRGVYSIADTIAVVICLASILLWGDRRVRFRRFDKWCLSAIGAIVIYGLMTGDAWHSNVFTQIVIGCGYIPTYAKLWQIKKNSEPITAWVCGLISSLISLHLTSGNLLATAYSKRAAIQMSVTLMLMLYYERRSKRA